jgi:hypothetical protein
MHQPIRDPDGHWPSCDDEQPGISIRPLSRADLAGLLPHLQHDRDQDLNHDDDLYEGPAWPAGRAPVAGGRVGRLDSHPALAGRCRTRRRRAGLGVAVSRLAGEQRLAAGAAGERRTARVLSRLEDRGWVVLHDRVVVSGVTVAPADRVPDLLGALPPVLPAEQVGWLADRARVRFRPAA